MIRNTDTSKATQARLRAVAVYVSDRRVGRYESVKECSQAIGIPSSRICEFAKNGRVYRNGYEFKYID